MVASSGLGPDATYDARVSVPLPRSGPSREPYWHPMSTAIPYPQDLLDLTGRVAIVTGASQGIGAGIAKRFAKAGARVVVHYRRDRQAAKHVVGAITRAGGTAVAIHADLDSEGEVTQFFAEADDRLGPVDILVNNAGQNFPLHPLAEISLDEWRAMFRDNLESTFLCTQAAAAVMRERGGGAIVNIGSISATNPASDHSHYNSAKAGGPGVHPVVCAGARAGRDPRQLGVARADPQDRASRKRGPKASSAGSRVRRSGVWASPRTSPTRASSWRRRLRAGSAARTLRSMGACWRRGSTEGGSRGRPPVRRGRPPSSRAGPPVGAGRRPPSFLAKFPWVDS